MPTITDIQRTLLKNRIVTFAAKIMGSGSPQMSREEMNLEIDHLMRELDIPKDTAPISLKYPGKRRENILNYVINNTEMTTKSGKLLQDELICIGKDSYLNQIRRYKTAKRNIDFESDYKEYFGVPIIDDDDQKKTDTKKLNSSRSVFVVHGHDEGGRESVARYLEKINFIPIILHEQANKGRTIIEKIEGHADVDFAVVLLTPDDIGSVKGGQEEPRARQNVLLELGYFIGKLGRDRVCALKKGNVALPSDFAGVVWEPMDEYGNWRRSLARELQAAGHEIDWNEIMRS